MVKGGSINGASNTEQVRTLFQSEEQLRSVSDYSINQRIATIRDELLERRQSEIQHQVNNLEEYSQSERERIKQRIDEYERKATTGTILGWVNSYSTTATHTNPSRKSYNLGTDKSKELPNDTYMDYWPVYCCHANYAGKIAQFALRRGPCL
ncbi:hypothetical protein [Halocatena halophila]|uniref:hypothetical protein n=1 Tax=Halocatena halophila TaxID=2814576 RepID=UPI002ED1801C